MEEEIEPGVWMLEKGDREDDAVSSRYVRSSRYGRVRTLVQDSWCKTVVI